MPIKVLIVEDNELNMKLFTDLINSLGYEVLQSVDGSDAIQIARNEQPKLILMDIQLPETSGIELTRTLKAMEDTKNIPVVAVTAFAMAGDREKVLDAGCDGYLPKPISVSEFLSEVTSFTG